MRLTVFGATGEAGQQIIAQALAAGDRVVAYARNPAKLRVAHERLTVAQGELTDEAGIEQAVSGADAVISVLGPRGDSRDKPITRGTQNILAAMKKLGVRRLIINSTVSAPDPNDSFDLRFKALVHSQDSCPVMWYNIGHENSCLCASDVGRRAPGSGGWPALV